MKPETLEAFDELRRALAKQLGANPDELVIAISQCGEPMDYLACPDCGGPAHWQPCAGCNGTGLITCECEGEGGRIVCERDCEAELLAEHNAAVEREGFKKIRDGKKSVE